MKLVFKSIRWKNFLSTGNYWNSIDLNINDNVLVYGENSFGKSTVLDALCFSLYGKAFRNINKGNLINSINQRECLTEIEFEINNKSYRILRGIKPNIFEIYCNDVLLNQDAAIKDYQEYLEKNIIKLNYKSFTQIVILGSASFTPFMQLTAADRRGVIEDLLNIQIFSTMNEIVRNKLSVNKDSILEMKYSKDLLEQRHDIIEKHLTESKLDKKNEIEKCENEIAVLNSDIVCLSEKKESLNEQLIKYQDIHKNSASIKESYAKLHKMKIRGESSLKKLQMELSFFCDNDTCPTCMQEISPNIKDEKKSEISEKINELNNTLIKLDNKIFIVDKNSRIMDNVASKIQELKMQIREIDILCSTNKTQRENIANKKQSLYNANRLVENTENDLIDIKNQIDVIDAKIIDLVLDKHHLEAAANMFKDNGIKTRIIKQYLPLINKTINKYLSLLEFYVDFSFDETFKETIKSRHRDEFSYYNFSEGEKSKINLAILFSWRELTLLKSSFNTNLLVMDEIIDGALDLNGIDCFWNLIGNLKDSTVFIISPKGENYLDKFSKNIKFIKQNGFSKIE